MSVIWETQKAVYEKLTGDTALMAMITGVYDHVPERSEFPYVTVGDFLMSDTSTKAERAYNLDLNLNVYSKARGRKEALEVMLKIEELLHNQPLDIEGYSHIFTRIISQGSSVIKDGEVYRGRSFYKFKIYQG